MQTFYYLFMLVILHIYFLWILKIIVIFIFSQIFKKSQIKKEKKRNQTFPNLK